jgi:hypothetical protein
VFDVDGGTVELRIPIKGAEEDFKLFEFSAVCFAWKEYTCDIGGAATQMEISIYRQIGTFRVLNEILLFFFVLYYYRVRQNICIENNKKILTFPLKYNCIL